ncbi:MAG: hypothetical protein JXA08_08600 [Methanomicrobiaceae archaeon]|nr:hypothetical protein [Methanomicrobiaceae archaeon]
MDDPGFREIELLARVIIERLSCMKCALCSEPGLSFLRVRHRDFGTILICRDCLTRERRRLLPPGEDRSCGCSR